MKKHLYFLFILIIFLSSVFILYSSEDKIIMFRGESRTLDIKEGVDKISVGDKDVLSVRALSVVEILLTGKNIGETSLIIWTEKGRKIFRKVIVTEVDIKQVMKAVKIRLRNVKGVRSSIKKGKIVLEGSVKNDSDIIIISSLVAKYKGVIHNLVKLPVQMIKINVRIVEISETYERGIGVDWQKRFQFAEKGIAGVFKIGEIGRVTKIDALLEFMEKEGKAKIIARPNIIVVNGETADFHSGGKILIPVFTEGKVASIDEKEYGVKLLVTPYGDRKSGLINTKVNIEVSSLDWENGVKYEGGSIPAIKSRAIKTIIDIQLNKTIVIAGMLMEEEETIEKRVPILGHIPLLGLLFKSTEKHTYKTELAIFLTPTFVNFIGEEIIE